MRLRNVVHSRDARPTRERPSYGLGTLPPGRCGSPTAITRSGGSPPAARSPPRPASTARVGSRPGRMSAAREASLGTPERMFCAHWPAYTYCFSGLSYSAIGNSVTCRYGSRRVINARSRGRALSAGLLPGGWSTAWRGRRAGKDDLRGMALIRWPPGGVRSWVSCRPAQRRRRVRARPGCRGPGRRGARRGS
jgi:hypothetical protein